jgi:phosphoglycerol transferase MdoB-like AlkP superfamily enzyme
MHFRKRVDSEENPFMSFTPEVGSAIYSSLIHDLKIKDPLKNPVLKSEKPNVILIIWEGFTAKIVEPLGGDHNITPYFNQLTKEGILFRNFYANGDRTDKG